MPPRSNAFNVGVGDAVSADEFAANFSAAKE
jgi:hypothetical protein